MAHQILDQPPLYLCPMECFTCGKPISSLWLKYARKRLEISDGRNTDLPLRIVSEKDLVDKSGDPTVEQKILDEMGLTRYCCRRMLLTQPAVEVPPPPAGTPLPKPVSVAPVIESQETE